MKTILILGKPIRMSLILTILVLAGCSTPRVLVKTPCEDAGPGLANCEKVKDL